MRGISSPKSWCLQETCWQDCQAKISALNQSTDHKKSVTYTPTLCRFSNVRYADHGIYGVNIGRLMALLRVNNGSLWSCNILLYMIYIFQIWDKIIIFTRFPACSLQIGGFLVGTRRLSPGLLLRFNS